jgi:hypothetical protein
LQESDKKDRQILPISADELGNAPYRKQTRHFRYFQCAKKAFIRHVGLSRIQCGAAPEMETLMHSRQIPCLIPQMQWPSGFQVICPGDRVCVTHVRQVRNFPGGPVAYEAGTISLGTVRNVDSDGFFDLYTDFDEAHGYYVNDPALRIQVLLPNEASTVTK